jgi:hypothetical protein
MVVVAEDGVDQFRQLSKGLPRGQLILHGVVVADLADIGMSHLAIASKYAKVMARIFNCECTDSALKLICWIPWLHHIFFEQLFLRTLVTFPFSQLTGVLEANYPERMHVCYILNAPWIFGSSTVHIGCINSLL